MPRCSSKAGEPGAGGRAEAASTRLGRCLSRTLASSARGARVGQVPDDGHLPDGAQRKIGRREPGPEGGRVAQRHAAHQPQRAFRAVPVGLLPAEGRQLQQGLGGQGISAGGGIILQVLGAHQHGLRVRRRIEEPALRVAEALQHLRGQASACWNQRGLKSAW